jgi:hypothetical protein
MSSWRQSTRRGVQAKYVKVVTRSGNCLAVRRSLHGSVTVQWDVWAEQTGLIDDICDVFFWGWGVWVSNDARLAWQLFGFILFSSDRCRACSSRDHRFLPRSESPCTYRPRGVQVFKNSRSHFQIVGAGRVTWNKFHTEDPRFWSDLWTALLSSALYSVPVKW